MKGFAALTSVIIIGAVLMAIGSMVVLTSINDGQMSLSGLQKNIASSFVNSCVEESLLFINEQSTLPANITMPMGNCATTINSQIGTSWDFSVSGTINGYTRGVRVKLNRGSVINVGSWQEQ